MIFFEFVIYIQLFVLLRDETMKCGLKVKMQIVEGPMFNKEDGIMGKSQLKKVIHLGRLVCVSLPLWRMNIQP